MPAAAAAAMIASIAAVRPDTTMFSGPFTAATDTSALHGTISSQTRTSSDMTATIDPSRGSAPMSRPRVATSVSASGSAIHPATHAATNSPTLWPITAVGRTPQFIHIVAIAYSTANSAGCVQAVSSSWAAATLSSNSSDSSGTAISGCRIAAHSSNAARNAGCAWYNARVIPGYCDPCPVNRNATCGVRTAAVPR